MTILPPISPEVYGSGRGVQEIAVWNLDGLADAGDIVAALNAGRTGRPMSFAESLPVGSNGAASAPAPAIVPAVMPNPVVTPPAKPAMPTWLIVLSTVVPVTLLLAWAAKKARE